LTAAFDTVDHALLIDRLERQFGLRDNVLESFWSYLSDTCRTFRVVYGGNTSRTVVIFLFGPTRISALSAIVHFYRAMHFSAKRGIAIACRLSVHLSVCL